MRPDCFSHYLWTQRDEDPVFYWLDRAIAFSAAKKRAASAEPINSAGPALNGGRERYADASADERCSG